MYLYRIEAQNNHYPSSSTTNAKWGESWRTSETDGAAESLNKQPTQENGSRRPRRINVADVISKRAATSSIPNNTSPSTADAGEIAEERADEAAAFASNSAGLTNRGTMIVLTSIKSYNLFSAYKINHINCCIIITEYIRKTFLNALFQFIKSFLRILSNIIVRLVVREI